MNEAKKSSNKELEFIDIELERICGLLQVEKPSSIDLRSEGIKSPIPKLKNNGQKIILYERGRENYTWQIGQAFISILKKRAPTWITRHPDIILLIMTFFPISFLFVIGYIYSFGLFIVILGTILMIGAHLFIGFKLSKLYVPRITLVARAMVKIGAWKENEANLSGENYKILESSICMNLMVILILIFMILGAPP